MEKKVGTFSDAARQQIAANHFVGKTVKSVDTTTLNCWIFRFTDGTKTSLENTDFQQFGDEMMHQLVIREVGE